jgi:hypothetical protein
VFAVGNAHTPAQLFDEGMYAPATPLGVTPLADAHNVAETTGAKALTGQGTGEAHQAIRDD